MRFKRVVIDAEQLCYAVGYASEGEPVSHALSTVRKAVDNIQKAVDAEQRTIYIKGVGNFREDIAVSK